ncbi:MAG: glycosyltransferase family 4 protein [Candidatus Acidiferrales bacterium]
MNAIERKPLLAVVSPFLDKSHGTERRVSEWISGLVDHFEIHLYSQRVADIDFARIIWHKIPKLPGPHLLNYMWWFFANHACRAWDRRFRGIRVDVVFSPGINCLDADVISVHIVFAEYAAKLANSATPGAKRISPRNLHRKLYYGLISTLERRIYSDRDKTLILIARKTDGELTRHFGRQTPSSVIYLGLDHNVFNPQRRAAFREVARRELGYGPDRFVLLLIGNHWANKGLPVLLRAVGLIRGLPIDILVVGKDNPGEYANAIRANQLETRVQFKLPRQDVEYYYAAADAYVGASLEDTFALPPAEAMACGLPVIVSAANGTSEIITHETDGLVLEEPTDERGLAEMIHRLYNDAVFRNRLGERAYETAQRYTWERNARELRVILEGILQRKSQTVARNFARES